jgi:hypothetical protein
MRMRLHFAAAVALLAPTIASIGCAGEGEAQLAAESTGAIADKPGLNETIKGDKGSLAHKLWRTIWQGDDEVGNEDDDGPGKPEVGEVVKIEEKHVGVISAVKDKKGHFVADFKEVIAEKKHHKEWKLSGKGQDSLAGQLYERASFRRFVNHNFKDKRKTRITITGGHHEGGGEINCDKDGKEYDCKIELP